MKVENFSIVDLLQIRNFLVTVLSTTKSFLNIASSKEDLNKIRTRLKQIDTELFERILNDKSILEAKDENFEETLEMFKESE